MIGDSSEFDVNAYPLKSKVVAIATDKYLTPAVFFQTNVTYRIITFLTLDKTSPMHIEKLTKNYSVGDNIDEKLQIPSKITLCIL